MFIKNKIKRLEIERLFVRKITEGVVEMRVELGLLKKLEMAKWGNEDDDDEEEHVVEMAINSIHTVTALLYFSIFQFSIFFLFIFSYFFCVPSSNRGGPRGNVHS